MHLVYPPPPNNNNKKLCITIVFDFSWDNSNTLDNLETMVMQNFGGKQGALWSIYESSDYKRCKASVKLSTQEGPMKLPDERQSLKRKEN